MEVIYGLVYSEYPESSSTHDFHVGMNTNGFQDIYASPNMT
jgi:hypothetical protein